MKSFLKLDWILLSAIFLLLAISLILLYSLSFGDYDLGFSNFKKQAVSIGIGLFFLFFFTFLDYRIFNFFSTKLYFVMIFFLGVVIFFGKTIRGTTGWIGISSYHIQPVEIAKLIIIIFLASFFSQKKSRLSHLSKMISSIVLLSFPIFLILKQPDFGSAAIVVFCWVIILSLSGVGRKILISILLTGSLIILPSWFLLKPYQKERIINFVQPENDPMGSGYNVIQSMVAVGSGKIFGKGLGHGSQSQLNFLPEKHTDFIFAVLAEELGFLGVFFILAIFGVIFWRIKEIGKLSRDNLGFLIIVGIMAMFFSQFLINIGMNIGAMPVVGITLPFLSYGGSSMVANLMAIGIVQSVYLRRIQNQEKDD